MRKSAFVRCLCLMWQSQDELLFSFSYTSYIFLFYISHAFVISNWMSSLFIWHIEWFAQSAPTNSSPSYSFAMNTWETPVFFTARLVIYFILFFFFGSVWGRYSCYLFQATAWFPQRSSALFFLFSSWNTETTLITPCIPCRAPPSPGCFSFQFLKRPVPNNWKNTKINKWKSNKLFLCFFFFLSSFPSHQLRNGDR